MLIKENTLESRHIRICRRGDHNIFLKNVHSFDTKTKRAEIYVHLISSDNKKIPAMKRDRYSFKNNLTLLNKDFKANIVKVKVDLMGYVVVDKKQVK